MFDDEYYEKTHEYDYHYYRECALRYSLFDLKNRVLDLGCGRGYIMTHLLDIGRDVYGVDISRYATTHPMPYCEDRIITADLKALPFIDDSFDLVICRAVLEHIPENDIPQVLREIRRVSNRGLYMIAIIADENRPELYEFWRKEDPSHITLKTFDWWKKRFEESGLQVTFYDGALQLIASRQQ